MSESEQPKLGPMKFPVGAVVSRRADGARGVVLHHRPDFPDRPYDVRWHRGGRYGQVEDDLEFRSWWLRALDRVDDFASRFPYFTGMVLIMLLLGVIFGLTALVSLPPVISNARLREGDLAHTAHRSGALVLGQERCDQWCFPYQSLFVEEESLCLCADPGWTVRGEVSK